MKVKNTSRRVIKLLNGKEKVVLVPGTDAVYDVTDCADVQFLIDAGDLIEVAGRRGRPPRSADDGGEKGTDGEKGTGDGQTKA